MKFVIDMMGGDNGVKSTIPAVKQFLENHDDVDFICVGDPALLSELKDNKHVKIIESKTVLTMDVDPMSAINDKDSSLAIAIANYKTEQANALITAGSTGALVTFGVFKIKRLEGVRHPGFISPIPTMIKGKQMVACDLGANIANTKEDLLNYAVMGSLYYKISFKKENPNVFLLNNGTEEEKGNELTKETYQLLKASKQIKFCGNIEARDPLKGECDVLIMDGFSGNIYLKSTEGALKVMSSLLKKAFKKNIFTKIGYLFARKGVKDISDTMDYKAVGGACLLGVDGLLLKAHGNSDPRAFIGCFNQAYTLAKEDMINKIKATINGKN
ncbi:MAG: phosphate acyltransferase PlsX [Erysipelotrichaceae bacterium]|nr:phosphate acyltransferase PlsX [Erysipelotrichaceae bacterium]MCB9500045.1 phosphate acyltransferase PlsX [Erysipelotrichaceae bacterium]